MIDPETLELRTKEDSRVCEALRFVDAHLSSVFDLVNTRSNDPKLIPTLLAVLPTVSDPWIKQGVVRALTIKEARGQAGPILISEFRSSKNDQLRWAIGNALSVTATPDLFEDLAELISDRTFGRTRMMLASALARVGKHRAESILLRLLTDESILPTVVRELGKLRSTEALPALLQLINHGNRLVRKEAEKALRRIRAA